MTAWPSRSWPWTSRHLWSAILLRAIDPDGRQMDWRSVVESVSEGRLDPVEVTVEVVP